MNIESLTRAYEREVKKRKLAEKLLEDKSRELFLSYENLKKSHDALASAHENMKQKQAELIDLQDVNSVITNDLMLAAKIQAQLLPGPLTLSCERATAQCSIRAAQYIAGDAADYFLLEENVLAFYMLDVAGHGAASALVSFAINNQLNAKSTGLCKQQLLRANHLQDAVSNTLTELNILFEEDAERGQYFTIVYGLVDLKTGEVSLCQAAHPPPLLARNADNTSTFIGEGGPPVGWFSDSVFAAYQCTMGVGDRLYVYSDGMTECFSPEGTAFGDQRLQDLVRESKDLSVETTLNHINEALIDWNGSSYLADDLSVLIVEYRG